MTDHAEVLIEEVADGRAPRRGRGAIWWWVLALVIAAALGVVCGRWAFAPPAVSTQALEPATVRVEEMTVGTSVPLAVSASWNQEPFGVGAAEGTLTSLDVTDGATVEAGQRLYTVDLRPVVAGTGTVPAFRDLSQGVTGVDVTQLQQLLVDLGFLRGGVDGKFGQATTTAVKAWQKSLGLAQDGVVRAGDIVYTPALPTRVTLAEGVEVGDRLAAGDVVLSVLVGEPEFVALITGTDSVDSSLPVEVTFEGEVVPAVVSSVRDDSGGRILLTLTREDGSPICADACDQVPLDPYQAVYPSRQVLIASVTGPGVPAAALLIDAGGSPYLLTPDGERLDVTILGQGQGRVVLDGVEVGTVVVLADETAQVSPPADQATPSGTTADDGDGAGEDS